MKLFASIFVFAFVFFAVVGAEIERDPRSTARAKYAKRPGDALSFVEPVKVIRGVGWKDGGTVGLELVDANDKKHTYSLYPASGAGLPVKDLPPKIIINLFTGATHPGHQGAKMVEVRGPEESALYAVLLRAIAKHKDKEAIFAKEIDEDLWTKRGLWGTDMLSIHTFFHRLESHFLKE